MKLPKLEAPDRYQGLYVFDFGEWTAVGYTAEEIAVLLESERYREGKVYRIHRAWPDGRLELRGVSPERFRLESGMFFYGGELERARRDWEDLVAAAGRVSPPCRAKLHLADRGELQGPARYVVALIYPAEYEEDVGRWLLEIDYRGGEMAEGGISHVTNYYEEANEVLERAQLWSRSAIPARPAEEVLASVREPVQRRLGA